MYVSACMCMCICVYACTYVVLDSSILFLIGVD